MTQSFGRVRLPARHEPPSATLSNVSGNLSGSVLSSSPTRRWVSSWAVHAVLLACLLAAMFALIGTDGILNSDESMALRQAEVLANDGQWSSPAESEIDPDGEWHPLFGVTANGDEFYSAIRLPLYPLVMSKLLAWGGVSLILATHAAAIWMAALLLGRAAERVSAGAGLVTMWLVGAGSPLVFDGYWVMGHAYGVAFASLAVWAVLRWLDRGGVWLLAVLGLALMGASNVRSEGVLLGIAISLSLVFVDRRNRMRAVLAAMVSAGTALAAYDLVSRWRSHILGDIAAARFKPSYGSSSEWLAGRIEGSRTTLFDAGSGTMAIATLAITLAVLIAAFARRWKLDRNVVLALGGVAVLAGVARLLLGGELIGGLLLTTPLGVLGILSLSRQRLRQPEIRVLLAAGLMSCGAVLALQYNAGAVAEWGGRYLHLGLAPLLVVCGIGLADLWRASDAETSGARWVIGAAVLATACLLGGIVQVQHELRRAPLSLGATMNEAAGQTASSEHPDGPLIVSTWKPWGRFVWDDIDRTRMFATDGPDELPVIADRMVDAGESDFVLVVRSDELSDAEVLAPEWVVAHQAEGEYGGYVLTMEYQAP